MDHKKSVTGSEARRRFQASVLPVFEEITRQCLSMIRSERASRKAFASLQSYLDQTITVGTISCRRRTILLTVHDMTDDAEAPATLQRKALAQLLVLNVRPVPQLRLYRDIATALLRIEVVLRESAAQAPVKSKTEPFMPASLVYREELRQWFQSSVEAASLGARSVIRGVMPQLQMSQLIGFTISVFRNRASIGASAREAVMST